MKRILIAPRYSGREKWMRVTLPSSWSTFGSGKGYSLLWPQGEEIKRFDWQPGAIVVPPDFWFHRHFNAGNMPARYLALRAAGKKFKGLRKLCGVNEDVKKGGSQMEYEDGDPRIHKEFEAGLARVGAQCAMGALHPRCTQKAAAA